MHDVPYRMRRGDVSVAPAVSLRGSLLVPADKSIAQRALLMAMMAEGESTLWIQGLCEDIHSTIKVCEMLGATIKHYRDRIEIKGTGGHLRAPKAPLNCGESATLLRLLMGLLSGVGMPVSLTGHPNLMQRPMQRVIAPLSRMGAKIKQSTATGVIHIEPAILSGIDHVLSVPSAQVKSSVLLAGLYAQSPTLLMDPWHTRNHTEILLEAVGCGLHRNQGAIHLQPEPIMGFSYRVPGDFSSAAFWLVAGSIVPGASMALPGVGCNDSRNALVSVLHQMGASIDVIHEDAQDDEAMLPEAIALYKVRHRPLRALRVDPNMAVKLIDELPILAIAAACANGRSVIVGAGELRHKESDRIAVMSRGLRSIGVRVQEMEDGWVIDGGEIKGGVVDAGGDHRIAMAFAVAGLVSGHGVIVRGGGCVSKSYRRFFDHLERLRVEK